AARAGRHGPLRLRRIGCAAGDQDGDIQEEGVQAQRPHAVVALLPERIVDQDEDDVAKRAGVYDGVFDAGQGNDGDVGGVGTEKHDHSEPGQRMIVDYEDPHQFLRPVTYVTVVARGETL